MHMKRTLFHFSIPLFFYFLYATTSILCEKQEEKPNIDQLLQRANEHFAKGEMEASHNLFRTILKWEPENTGALYQHANCLNALGKISNAKDTWSKLIALKPTFHNAYIMRAKLHLKEGDFDKVEKDTNEAQKLSPSDASVKELKTLLSRLKKLHESLEAHHRNNDSEKLLTVVDDLLKHTTHSVPIRLKRTEAFLQTKQYVLASGEYYRLYQLSSNPDYLGHMAELLYFSLYQPEKAMSTARNCLVSAPDHPLCFKIFKSIKTHREILDAKKLNLEALTSLKKSLPPTAVGMMGFIASKLCKPTRNKVTCQEAVEMYPDRSDLVKFLIDLYLESNEKEELEKAEQLVDEALKRFSDSDAQQTWSGLKNKVQLRLKQASKKDHYKILEIPRTATAAQIKKAYRRLAMKYHPDKQSQQGENALTREAAEAKMRDINAAYTVLSDPEAKKKYDSTGEDPYDPTSGQASSHTGGFPEEFFDFFYGGGGAGSQFRTGNQRQGGGSGGRQFFFFQG